MQQFQRDFITRYSYLSMYSGNYIFSIDDSRFTNHSKNLNNIDTVDCDGSEPCGVANRDIHAGEELLVNYLTFDVYDATSDEEYLKY